VRNNAGGFWNHGLFFLHNLAPAGTQASAHLSFLRKGGESVPATSRQQHACPNPAAAEEGACACCCSWRAQQLASFFHCRGCSMQDTVCRRGAAWRSSPLLLPPNCNYSCLPAPLLALLPVLQKYSDDASEELQTAIWEAFGDYDTLKANFSAAAAGVFGSG
jgi:hypothetical protein